MARLPRVCRPQHCEVLVIRRGGPITNVPGLRLVPVGEGDLRTATLFGDAIPAQDLGESAFVEKIRRYHRPAPPPLVLANGVAALDRSPVLHDAYRSYGWVVPLGAGRLAPGRPMRWRRGSSRRGRHSRARASDSS